MTSPNWFLKGSIKKIVFLSGRRLHLQNDLRSRVGVPRVAMKNEHASGVSTSVPSTEHVPNITMPNVETPGHGVPVRYVSKNSAGSSF